MTGGPMIDRRRFLIAGGTAGLVIGFGGPLLGDPDTAATPLGKDGADPPDAAYLNAWIRIAPDGAVTIRCGRSEMGQGIFTGLATLVAEELDCRWDRVRVETGPADPAFKNIAGGRDLLAPDHGLARGEADQGWLVTKLAEVATEQFTGGSSGIRDGFVRARQAGAVARRMLAGAAATAWGVDPDTLSTADGIVTHDASGRSLSYGDLAAAAATIDPPRRVTLKPRADWVLIGRSLPRVDIPAKTDGSAQFASDVRLPGMLFAAVAHCPVFGGTLERFDAAAVAGMPGVRAVRPVPGGVAVVADGTWRARKALDALPVVWNEGPHADLDDAGIRRRLTQALDEDLSTGFEQGDVGRSLPAAARRVSAEYHLPYLAHAPMEPMTCTAAVTADGVEVWAPTQAQSRTVKAAADAAGVPADRVRVHTPYLGGGFGRRGEVDFVVQAVTLARELGVPVQVSWSREEDMRHDFYRPAAAARLEAGLDGDGLPVAWHLKLAGQSIMARVFPPATWLMTDPTLLEGGVHLPYAIAHQRVDYGVRDLPVPVGPWRSVGHSLHAFFKECFLDEVAHAGGHDPVALRRRLLSDRPRLRAVLDLAADRAGWDTAPEPGTGRGVALHVSFGTAVALVAEVAVAPDGGLRVNRVTAAVDCGTVVNPAIVEAQIQGAVIEGLSAALFGRITIDRGRVVEGNFPDYPLVRMADMPEVAVHIVDSDAPPGGIGEPGLPPVAPAVANAVFAATGRRIRALPLTDQGLRV